MTIKEDWENNDYEQFALSIPSDIIAYEVIYNELSPIGKNIIDYGCFQGKSSYNLINKSANNVIGVDKFENNINIAKNKYKKIDNLTFSSVEDLDKNIKFNSGFITFVHPTISAYKELNNVFYNIRNFIEENGKIVILGLHPNSLNLEHEFLYYKHKFINGNKYSDGVPFENNISLHNGEKLKFIDYCWTENTLIKILEKNMFKINKIINLDEKYIEDNENILNILKSVEFKYKINWIDEWKAPLYHIIIADKIKDKITVNPLNEEQYAKTFKEFIGRYKQETSIINKISDQFLINKKKEYNILSIGAGSGNIDKCIFDKINCKINYYAVEPNNYHCNNLLNNFKNTNYIINIKKDYFDKKFKLDENLKFDFIFMFHSLYYINDPIESIIHARSFLNEYGKLIIIHQGETGIFEIFNKFNKKVLFSKNKLSDHGLSGSYIIEKLKELNIYCDKTNFKYNIDVSDIFENNENVTHDIISFIIQTDTKMLPVGLYKKVIEDVKNNTENCNFVHCDDLLII